MKIPREKFDQLSKGKSTPYCFEIKKRNQVLSYFGANHSHDPKNKQYPALKKYWATFLKNRNPLKLVVVERGLHSLEENEKLAIVHGSENSFMTFLAYQERIPIISPEPSEKEIIALLRKKFPEDKIQYYHFATYVDSWRRHNPRPNFEPWISEMMLWNGRRLGFKQFALPHLKAIHKKLFHQPFSLRDKYFFNSITNPNEAGTVINEVARFSSDIRDVAVISQLRREWREGRSLFVAYGAGHAFIQEEILRKTLK